MPNRSRRIRRIVDSPEERSSSSSSSDDDANVDLSIPDLKLRWGSLDRHTLYHAHGFSTRSFVREKIVNLSSLAGINVHSWLSDLGWEPLFNLTDPIFPDLIREFYFNMTIRDDFILANVRGRSVRVSPSSIAQLVPLPRVTNPSYPLAPSSSPDSSFIMSTVCRIVQSGTIYHKNLHPDFKVLNWIVCACLIPRANSTQITKSHVELMFAISIKAAIDLPAFIYLVIKSVKYNPSGPVRQALPFAVLITRHCLDAGCPRLPSDVPVTRYQKLDMTFISRSRSHLPSDTPHISTTHSTSSQSATASTPAPSCSSTSRVHSIPPAVPQESEDLRSVCSQVEEIQKERRQYRALLQELLLSMQRDREAQAHREEVQARRDEAKARRDSMLLEHLEAIRRMKMLRGAGSSGSGSHPDGHPDDAPPA